MLGLVLLTVLVGGSFAADDDVCFAHVEVRKIGHFCHAQFKLVDYILTL